MNFLINYNTALGLLFTDMPPGMGFPHPPHPPQMGPGMPPIGPMPPGMMPRQQPTVIAKPPTVYSAKPVKFTKNKGEQKEKKEKKEQIETEEKSKTSLISTCVLFRATIREIEEGTGSNRRTN